MKVMAGVSAGGIGHLMPLVPLLREFVRRGDEVVVVAPDSLAGPIRAAGLCHQPGAAPDPEQLERIWTEVRAGERRQVGHLIDREVFGRLATAALLPTTQALANRWRPDLVLREPCEYSSAVVATRMDICQAQVGISLSATEASVLRLVEPVLEPYVAGLHSTIVNSPFIARFPPSIDRSPFPHTYRLAEHHEATGELPDFWAGRGGPFIYVTFGTVVGGTPNGREAYRVALDAVTDLPVRVLVTLGRSMDPRTIGPVPANVHIDAWIPQADVLQRADLVVCHGGSGTVLGALAAGVPLVMLPMFADQPSNGRVVEAAGAGLVVAGGGTEAVRRVGDDDVPALREAIATVLANPAYTQAVRRLSNEMRSSRTVEEIATLLAEAAGS